MQRAMHTSLLLCTCVCLYRPSQGLQKGLLQGQCLSRLRPFWRALSASTARRLPRQTDKCIQIQTHKSQPQRKTRTRNMNYELMWLLYSCLPKESPHKMYGCTDKNLIERMNSCKLHARMNSCKLHANVWSNEWTHVNCTQTYTHAHTRIPTHTHARTHARTHTFIWRRPCSLTQMSDLSALKLGRGERDTLRLVLGMSVPLAARATIANSSFWSFILFRREFPGCQHEQIELKWIKTTENKVNYVVLFRRALPGCQC